MHLESVCVSPALHFVAMDMPFLDTGCNLFSLSAVLFSFRTHDQPLNQGSISPILQRERSNSKTYQISNLTDQPFTPFSGSLLNLASGSRSTSNPTPILHNLVQPSQSFIPYSNFLNPPTPPFVLPQPGTPPYASLAPLHSREKEKPTPQQCLQDRVPIYIRDTIQHHREKPMWYSQLAGASPVRVPVLTPEALATSAQLGACVGWE